MKNIYIATIALNFFAGGLSFCADESSLVSASKTQNAFPKIELLDHLELDCHTPARNKALKTGTLYAVGASLGVASTLWLLSESNASITDHLCSSGAIAGLGVGTIASVAQYIKKKEDLRWLQNYFWNPLIDKYNRAATIINELDPKLKELIAEYRTIGPESLFVYLDEYLKEHPEDRKKIYDFVLSRNTSSSHELHTRVETQLQNDIALLEPVEETINNLLYACHEGPLQSYWLEYLRNGNREKLSQYTQLNNSFGADDPLDTINKEKIKTLNDVIEKGGVLQQQYLEIKRAYEIANEPYFFERHYAYNYDLQDSIYPELKKSAIANRLTRHRKNIKQHENQFKINKINTNHSYANQISKHNAAVDNYHQHTCDKMFDKYLPQPPPKKYTVPQEVLASLLSNEALQLHVYPNIEFCNSPQQTAQSLIKIKETYRQDIKSIAYWHPLALYCDNEGVNRINNVLFGRSVDARKELVQQQDNLRQTFEKHKETIKEFITTLETNAAVIGSLPESTDPNTIKSLIANLQSTPDGWQCRPAVNTKPAARHNSEKN